jgi:hypothetical protein
MVNATPPRPVGIHGVVDRVGEEPRRLVLALGVDAQQRVPVHRRGIIEVRRGEDQRHALRVQSLAPLVKSRAGLPAHARPVKCELPVEPVVAGDEGALGVLDLLGLLCVGEEGGERGFQLARGSVFPSGARKNREASARLWNPARQDSERNASADAILLRSARCSSRDRATSLI